MYLVICAKWTYTLFMRSLAVINTLSIYSLSCSIVFFRFASAIKVNNYPSPSPHLQDTCPIKLGVFSFCLIATTILNTRSHCSYHLHPPIHTSHKPTSSNLDNMSNVYTQLLTGSMRYPPVKHTFSYLDHLANVCAALPTHSLRSPPP